MKITSTISRYLLGLIFTVFGLNGFLHFIHQPPPPSPLAVQFFTVMGASHYLVPVFLVQLVGGLLLLSGWYVPLALTVLAPVIVNILIYHTTMDPGGLPLAVVTAILWILVYVSYRSSFTGLLQARPTQP